MDIQKTFSNTVLSNLSSWQKLECIPELPYIQPVRADPDPDPDPQIQVRLVCPVVFPVSYCYPSQDISRKQLLPGIR